MLFNPINIAWIIFVIFAARMAFRMWDGRATFSDFLLSSLVCMGIAALIVLAGRLYQRWIRKAQP